MSGDGPTATPNLSGYGDVGLKLLTGFGKVSKEKNPPKSIGVIMSLGSEI